MPPPDCPFCDLPPERVWLANEHAVAFRDAFPVAEGHTLVIPRAHRVSLFDGSPDELAAVLELVVEVRRRLADELHPDAFTVGLNDGVAAGQTVMHGHVHVIPRFHGDVVDPRGGVRHVLPARDRYWTDP